MKSAFSNIPAEFIEKFHLGAFLEIDAPPISYPLTKRFCGTCDLLQTEGNFCAECGAKIEPITVEVIKPAQLDGLLHLGGRQEEFEGVLFQLPITGPNGEIYCIGNDPSIINPNSFHGRPQAEIEDDTRQKHIQAFRQNYREVIEYLTELQQMGKITTMTVKFGFLEYYR